MEGHAKLLAVYKELWKSEDRDLYDYAMSLAARDAKRIKMELWQFPADPPKHKKTTEVKPLEEPVANDRMPKLRRLCAPSFRLPTLVCLVEQQRAHHCAAGNMEVSVHHHDEASACTHNGLPALTFHFTTSCLSLLLQICVVSRRNLFTVASLHQIRKHHFEVPHASTGGALHPQSLTPSQPAWPRPSSQKRCAAGSVEPELSEPEQDCPDQCLCARSTRVPLGVLGHTFLWQNGAFLAPKAGYGRRVRL